MTDQHTNCVHTIIHAMYAFNFIPWKRLKQNSYTCAHTSYPELPPYPLISLIPLWPRDCDQI